MQEHHRNEHAITITVGWTNHQLQTTQEVACLSRMLRLSYYRPRVYTPGRASKTDTVPPLRRRRTRVSAFPLSTVSVSMMSKLGPYELLPRASGAPAFVGAGSQERCLKHQRIPYLLNTPDAL